MESEERPGLDDLISLPKIDASERNNMKAPMSISLLEGGGSSLGISSLLNMKSTLTSQLSFGPMVGVQNSLTFEQKSLLDLFAWLFVYADKESEKKAEPFNMVRALDQARKSYKPPNEDEEILDAEVDEMMVDSQIYLNKIMEEIDDQDLDDDEVGFEYYVRWLLVKFDKTHLLDDPDDLSGIKGFIKDTMEHKKEFYQQDSPDTKLPEQYFAEDFSNVQSIIAADDG